MGRAKPAIEQKAAERKFSGFFVGNLINPCA